MSADRGLRDRSRLLLLFAAGMLLAASVSGLPGLLRERWLARQAAGNGGDVIDLRSVDINRAPAGTLETLPGVGPVLAARIAAERERGGPFASAADLRRVKGIGASLSRALEPYLIFPR